MQSRWSIQEALQWAKTKLAGVEHESLDPQYLLAEVLQKNRTYLHTWPEALLTEAQQILFEKFVLKRRQGIPVAYIVGHKGFWTLDLQVAPSTLIPRPETELLVEIVLDLNLANADCLDLGTGTGAIALAIASEKPQWQITGVDVVQDAVTLAQSNARRNNITNARFMQSNWFAAIESQRFDIIVSNPPYVEDDSPYLQQGDVRFEPASALTSGKDGMKDILHIIANAKAHLNPQGWLLFEHGYQQADAVQQAFQRHNFKNIHSKKDYSELDRVTLAQI